jgi:hypothetical protein
MNLVTILIPFLLAAIKSFELSVIDTTLPSMSQNKSKSSSDEKKDKPLVITLQINDTGMTLNGANQILAHSDYSSLFQELELDSVKVPSKEPGAKPVKGVVLDCLNNTCKTRKSYPWAKLRELLIAIKSDERVWCTGIDTDAIVLQPDSEIKFDTLVIAMDVSRSDEVMKEFGITQKDTSKPEYNVLLDHTLGDKRCVPQTKKNSPVVADAPRPLFPKVAMAGKRQKKR